VACFRYLPVNLFGHLRERVAALARGFFNLKFGVIEAVLSYATDSELNRAQLYFKPEQSCFRIVRVGICATHGAERLQLLVSEERVQAFYVAFAVGAAGFGHDGVARPCFPFVRGVVWVKHFGHCPEELSHGFAHGSGRAPFIMAVLFFAARRLFLFMDSEQARKATFNLSLDFGKRSEAASDRFRVTRPEDAHLFLQQAKLSPALFKESFQARNLARYIERLFICLRFVKDYATHDAQALECSRKRSGLSSAVAGSVLHARLIRYTFGRKKDVRGRKRSARALRKESMKKHDGTERRRAERIRVNFKARWEGAWARREGHITDLSAVGCFILTPDLVKPGEPVKLEIQLPKGEIKIEGQVVYKVEEMGFAIEFTAASAEDRKRLAWLIRAEAQLAQRR
jgi:hypothetical protein